MVSPRSVIRAETELRHETGEYPLAKSYTQFVEGAPSLDAIFFLPLFSN